MENPLENENFTVKVQCTREIVVRSQNTKVALILEYQSSCELKLELNEYVSQITISITFRKNRKKNCVQRIKNTWVYNEAFSTR
jgi:hypothetical protein